MKMRPGDELVQIEWNHETPGALRTPGVQASQFKTSIDRPM